MQKIKVTLVLALTLVLQTAIANTLDSLTIENNKLLYHKVFNNNNKLLIYMHGGVKQFEGLKEPARLQLDDMFEENERFIPSATSAGYDILIPIAHNEYNWLVDGGKQFIDELLKKHSSKYVHIVLSGFSDGGTGTYRMFYKSPRQFDGVIIFNGYPQHSNNYQNSDYFEAIGKNIVFTSTTDDKVIPYEFPLIEFRRQQMVNKHTYFLLRNGVHSFTSYSKEDFDLCFSLLAKKHQTNTEGDVRVYPPIDGLIIDGKVSEVYPFRKKKGKTYQMSSKEVARDDYSYKELSKALSSEGEIEPQSTTLSKKELKTRSTIDFNIVINGKTEKISFINWLINKTW